MSGVAHKGPERPDPSASSDPSPLFQESGFKLKGKLPKIVMVILCFILAAMFIIAFGVCLAEGIKFKQPRYFLLIVNMVLSTLVTGLLIFWFYRGSLSSMMIWYVFVQCLFLLFQFITTDIFAAFEASSVTSPTKQPPTATPWMPIANCSLKPPPAACNDSNGTNSTFFGPTYEQTYITY